MEVYKEKGIYDMEGDVYVLKTLEDWDEYEKICREKDPDFLKTNPNFFQFKEDFKKYIGKIWQDKTKIRYLFNGVPVYVEYKVIALEDNNPWLDWYWIMQNVDDDRDIKRVTAVLDIKYDIKL